MKRFTWSIPFLLTAGCGVAPPGVPPPCLDGSACVNGPTAPDASIAGPDLVDPRTISTPVPDHADVAAPNLPADSSSMQLPFDPFTGFLVEAVGVDALLSLVFDEMAIDQLNTGGPRLSDSLTFLERLCREGNTPDFICRNRYGN